MQHTHDRLEFGRPLKGWEDIHRYQTPDGPLGLIEDMAIRILHPSFHCLFYLNIYIHFLFVHLF